MKPVRAQPREVLCHRGIPLHSKEEMKTAREAARDVTAFWYGDSNYPCGDERTASSATASGAVFFNV
jgi:hypothetical protein